MIESNRVEYKRLQPFKYKTASVRVFLTDICPDSDIQHEFFTLSTDGILTIAPGYAWDGASGWFDKKSIMRGSLAHDVFYQAKQLCLPLPADWKAKADLLLKRLCQEDGMWSAEAACVFKAVKMFGRGRSRDLNPYDEILIAP